jgi:pyruvate ferredoxin oxidoreductase gamma subunit
MNECALPDPSGLFEIRFESIGGLGANSAGKILATAAVLDMNLNGSHFSSYGSEKKGSVVRSYVRLGAADKPIRTSAPIDSPDVIVVFHDALAKQDITIAGMKDNGIVIYNGQVGDVPETLEKLPAGTKIVRIDATNIAMAEFSRANAVMLGTLCEVVPFLDGEQVLDKLTAKFKQINPKAAAANERAFERGATEFEVLEGVAKGEGDLPVIRPTPILGYETAPMGGVIPNAGNTISNDLSASRTGYMPKFAGAKCIHCGLCATVCPDFCLSWTHEKDEEGEMRVHLKGIDYQYCKGCMRCVETCPTEAMVRVTETPGLADSLRVPLYADKAPAA